ncbi:MAG: peptidoglycan editing factor PgeF [Rickettsiales bacterium]|nr:peptidoglycan editing factor PgeF [Rickettsiales bacterium]
MMLAADTLASLQMIRHGFFTRKGGVSGGLYAGLNCGPGSQDDPAHVHENRARAARYLGAVPESLCTLYQVHGAGVVTVNAPWDAHARPQADAMVTNLPGILLGILTADCVPVLLVDPKARVIGAAHAGWKGAFAGVLEATVDAMQALGAHPDRLIAAIGPAIGWTSYEVDRAFLARFLEADARNEQFFSSKLISPAAATMTDHLSLSDDPEKTSLYFNVKGYAAWRLAQAGVHHMQILGNDTYIESSDFFSFRRATHHKEADYGRQLSAIMLREDG